MKMKTFALGLLVLGFAGSAFALDKAALDDRIRMLTAKFDALQQKPDKAVPADSLRKAQGVILLDRTKAGFIFAFQGGGGGALVRDPKTHNWGPVAFLSANEASLGPQIGGQQSFIVILLMSTNATRLLTEPTFEFGGEAQGTAGNQSAGVSGAVSSPEHQVLVYGDHQGLFGGVSMKAGSLAPDDQANRIYYGQFLSMADLLFQKKVQPTPAATDLAAKLNDYSKSSQK